MAEPSVGCQHKNLTSSDDRVFGFRSHRMGATYSKAITNKASSTEMSFWMGCSDMMVCWHGSQVRFGCPISLRSGVQAHVLLPHHRPYTGAPSRFTPPVLSKIVCSALHLSPLPPSFYLFAQWSHCFMRG